LELHCTNGRLPEKLHAGDVCQPTDTSPELAEFTNLRPPTAAALPPLGGNTLWRLLSHLYVNYLSVATTENLRSILKLYIFGRTGDNASQVAHIGRVDGIEQVRVTPSQRMVKDMLLRGQDIHIVLKRDNFAGDGDMYVFSAMLAAFLGSYAAVNCYTCLHVTDSAGRLSITWPARLGARQLL
ncbi:MAG: type VI secretion system baseplate subunit TssF, partial [Desulfovibrionaceae bacterium]|nr:type VI secretion system baseplate subunit TssF [Desulfovibrionaceae bacterium]